MTTLEYSDYGQLLDLLVPEKVGDEEGQISALNDKVWKDYDGDAFVGDGKRYVSAMRGFLEGLLPELEGLDYVYPLFRGLSEIEDDWTFVKFFMLLIRHMWV